MELEKIDKRMFEYLGHLRFGKVDHKDLSWSDYLSRPSSEWRFPEELDYYFKKVFFENKDIIKNKKILDVGCEYGNKIPWFDKMNPKELICLDPNSDDIYIANYVGCLVETSTKCVVSTAEDFELVADSVFMLSVNHHLKNEFLVYEKIKCTHLVIDTWTDRDPDYSKILSFLSTKYELENETYIRKNRVILRFKTR